MRRTLLCLVVLFTACNFEARQSFGPDFSVRRLVVVPDTVSIDPLGQVQFHAYGQTESGDTVGVFVQWSASVGSVSSDAVYTADTTEGDADVVAQLGGGPDEAPLVGTAKVKKRRIVALLLSPSTVSLSRGSVQAFSTLAVRGAGDTVPIVPTYSATGGTITSAGVYTAGPIAGNYRVIASRPSGIFDTAHVTIADAAVASVDVNPTAANVPVGGIYQLQAMTKDAAGNALTGRAVTWASDAPAIASVSATGLVSGIAAGSAHITATSEGQSGSTTITVAMVPVATVLVAPGTANLRVGTSALFIATPKDAAGDILSGRTITWSSDAPGVASVTADGLVSAVATGTATITATSEGQSGSSSVIVSAVPVASVNVSPATATLRIGTSVQLNASTRDSAGNVLIGRTVTWSSSAPGVAGVSAGGLVSALANGSATITATSEGKTATAAITVTVVPVASISVSPTSASLFVGRTVQLSATTKDSANNVVTGRTVTWSSSTPGVATVSGSGVVTAVSAGSATITVTSEGVSMTSAITVAVAPVASVTISPAAATLRIGTKVQLTATTKDSAGSVLTGRVVTWLSNAPTVASVSASGLVTAVALGSASITATSEGKSATITITVTQVPVSTVTVTPSSASLSVGATQQLSAVTKDSAGNVLTGRAITWSSSAAGVGSVSVNGLVTAVAVGSATVTATSEGKTGSAAITVTSSTVTHAGWYVSPSGSSGGDGSAARPWNLQTGLNGGGGKIRAGDTLWLRGGTYAGAFSSNLNGTAAAPIVVRQYPGERATIDGGQTATSGTDILTVNGSYTWYWGFEVMSSYTQRNDPNAGTGTPLRGDGVYINNAHDLKLINLIVHDMGHGTYTEDAAHNIEIYGWIIYNGGTQSSARSDGHGIYIKNDGNGWKVARDNVIFNQFGFGIHGYAESGTHLLNLVFDGNVLFNNGTPSNYDNPNMQLGGTVVADNDSVTNNVAYYSPGVSTSLGNIRIGYNSLQNGTAVLANNYLIGGTRTLDVGYWTNLGVRSNLIVAPSMAVVQHDGSSASTESWTGDTHYRDPTAQAWQLGGSNLTFANWQSRMGATDQATTGTPTGPVVVIRPNRYERGRALVAIYNPTQQGTVSVDLSGVLAVGAQYQVRNVQDIFGAPVVSGTFGGGSISIPMSGVAPPQPIGGSFKPVIKTGPFFDAFIVTSAP